MRPMDSPPQPTPRATLGEDPRNTSTTSNSWINANTCGWGTNPGDDPFTCDPPYTCITNMQNIVGCMDGMTPALESDFATTCIAVAESNPDAATQHESRVLHGHDTDPSDPYGPETAVCSETDAPACVTLLFPGDPPASKFRCGTTAQVITVNSVPWNITAIESVSRPPPSPTGDTARPAETSPSQVPSTAESASPLATTKTSPPTTTAKADTHSSSNAGTVAGAVVAGILFLVLLSFLGWYIFRKKSPKKVNMGPYMQQPPSGGFFDDLAARGRTRSRRRAMGKSPKHIPIELDGYNPRDCPPGGPFSPGDYGPGGAGPSSGPARQEREGGFGLGSVYVDGSGGYKPGTSMSDVQEEPESVVSSGSGGRAREKTMPGMSGPTGGGGGAEKGKGKVDSGTFSRAARVSDASSEYSQDGAGWKGYDARK
ncbi:hypothetical protein QBC39DRAFT_386594 [Podospora conica]|nr:hypothetical protein QBC39DRAFT_386594 [Schizothecium conicum]